MVSADLPGGQLLAGWRHRYAVRYETLYGVQGFAGVIRFWRKRGGTEEGRRRWSVQQRNQTHPARTDAALMVHHAVSRSRVRLHSPCVCRCFSLTVGSASYNLLFGPERVYPNCAAASSIPGCIPVFILSVRVPSTCPDGDVPHKACVRTSHMNRASRQTIK